MKLRSVFATVLCLATLAGPALAGEDDDMARFERQFAKDSGILDLPVGTNLSDFSAANGEIPSRGNETPAMVRQEIADLRDQATISNFLDPKEAAVVERQLTQAKVRLKIAEARQERDRLRSKNKKREAEKVDRAIHDLKAELAKLTPESKFSLKELLKADAHD